tara:strand:- start:393 stop:1106 length:714 start_codon:yes stop_codon:yes gene_type:complete
MSKSENIFLITGASTGIGRALSKKLCLENNKVILVSSSRRKLQLIEKDFSNLGFDFHIIKCDISNEQEVESLYKESTKIGNVNCVINNAGIGIFSKINEMKVSDWDKQMGVNLRGSFLITKKFSNPMIEKNNGMFVFVNSVAGMQPYPYSSGYVASKYALRGFSSSIREEFREHNIKVVSIHPGAVSTPFWDKINGDFPKDKMMSSEDVAETIYHAIMAPNSSVTEELVVRRTLGDF